MMYTYIWLTLPPLNNNNHNPRFIINTMAKLTQKPQSMSCAPFNVKGISQISFAIKLMRLSDHHLWLPLQSLL